MNLAQINSNLLLVLITAITILTGEELNDSSVPSDLLYGSLVPVHYDVKLFIDKYVSHRAESSNKYGHFLLYGDCSITINIFRSMQSIKLDAVNMVITNLTRLIKSNGVIYKLKEFLYISEEELLDLHFFNELSPGLYILKMELNHITDNAISFFSSYINKEQNIIWLVAPHIQAFGARRLFPCWDRPYFKTTFAISVEHDRNFAALSNMPIRNHYYMRNNDTMWTHFYTTPPISTYQISIVLSSFSRIHINANISLWYEKSSRQPFLKYAQRIIDNITLHLASEFKEIEIPKIDHVVIPNLPQNSTSKWGLVFHRETDLIYDEEFDPIIRKIEIARCIASKIAYQWLGNVISRFWWSDLWLHDVLATLFGEEAIVKIFNNSQIMDFFVVQSQYESLHLDSHFDMNPPQINRLSEIDSIFSFPRTIKTIVILRMFQNTVTDVVFRKHLHTYLRKNIFNLLIVSPLEFWSIQEDIANVAYQFIMSQHFLSWIVYRHYPVIKWTQESDTYGKVAHNFNTSNYGKWSMLISLIRETSLPKTKERWLTPQIPYIHVYNSKNDWVIVNIQQAGYYRVKYESENWHKIAHYLNSRKYKNISAINRAKIIDDAFHFMILHQLNSSIFWELTNYLWQETDYAAWYPMIKMFEYISNVFPLSKGEINFINIKEKIKKLLGKSLEILGFEERPMENDLTKCLRQEITKWACTLEHPECLRMANFKLEQHLKNPELFKILPGWKEWTYCKGFMTADTTTWPHLREIWLEKSGSKYVKFFTCFQDDSIMDLLLAFLKFELLEQNATKIDTNSINIFHSIVEKYTKSDAKLERILWNFREIKPKEISTTAALINIINHVYSTKQLDQISFFLKYKEQIYLGKLALKVQRKIDTRLIEIERQINYFQTFLN